ncbi:MAG TPA: GGDEF domain-containing protein [Terracidiphilus sp.]|nr:GGDEF domain-containing protein [Terracidiphilus sp.]
MKKFISALAFVLCASAWASQPALTTLRAVRALTNNEAVNNPPVSFEATVTYYDNIGVDLFVQDGDKAIYVAAYPGLNLLPGDRILIDGTVHPDFRPDVGATHITLLRHGQPPAPIPATFNRLIRAQLDCMRVSVSARVRSADIFHDGDETGIYLNLLVDGGYVDASILSSDESVLKDLLDADVQITGVAAGKFDSKMQLTGILLEVSSLSDVKIQKHAAISPQALPITPMDRVLEGYGVDDHSQRIRTRGTVTYYERGIAAVLQDGSKSLWVTTLYEGPLAIGQIVDASGFPDVRDGSLTLTNSEFSPTSTLAPIAPLFVSSSELAPGKHAFELVSTEGRVLAIAHGAVQDEYVLTSGGHVFSALLGHPGTSEARHGQMQPKVKGLEVGSTVRVTGICTLEHGSDPLGVPVAFNILMRSLNDLQVTARPSLLNTRNLVVMLGLLLLAVIVAAARGWILERKLRRQTTALAQRIESEAALERRRSRILEDINAGRPLHETIEQITALVSFGLGESPCWYQTASGAIIGNQPAELTPVNVIRQDIVSRSGPPHGEIFVVLNSAALAETAAPETLSIGAWLTALAIETHVLYADLRRRSEFDLLTEVHNRFSFEKRVEAAIAAAGRNSDSVFGLIYIDLDEFKQVNDNYGHRAGDSYLQQAAQRMKHQLRPGDMLARLGGDEFGVLVHKVRTRTDLEQIALRLGRCFDSPFAITGCQLRGAASLGVAIYPEDGDTKDTLLSAADAAMYVAKHTKKSNDVQEELSS